MGQSVYVYRVSVKWGRNQDWEHGRSQGKQKVLYYFVVFAIINELLIIKNRRINPAYWLMQARDEMRPSSH